MRSTLAGVPVKLKVATWGEMAAQCRTKSGAVRSGGSQQQKPRKAPSVVGKQTGQERRAVWLAVVLSCMWLQASLMQQEAQSCTGCKPLEVSNPCNPPVLWARRSRRC
jgi:hypothetical protein